MRKTWAATICAGVVLGLAGCGAAGPPTPSPSPSAAPTPAISVPADGVSLAGLGFTHGPVGRVFLPLEIRLASRVDQTNNVTLVLTNPSAASLAAYLRRTLPTNGFAITADNPATDTLTFAGFGWTGTFTGDTQASALLLRPAS